MSQVAIVGLDPDGKGRAFLSIPFSTPLRRQRQTEAGIARLGDRSKSRLSTFGSGSDAKSWSVTVGAVTAAFYSFTPYSGPFSPGASVNIASHKIQNTGTLEGTIHVSVDHLNSDGTVIGNICTTETTQLAGSCIYLHGAADDPFGPCTYKKGEPCDYPGMGSINQIMPSTPGTYYYGIKTWGEDEPEPSYPVPDSASQPPNAKAWSVVVEVPCTCTEWVNAECTAVGKRRQTRTCTPAGCDIEERTIDDASCAGKAVFHSFTPVYRVLPDANTKIATDVVVKNDGNVAARLYQNVAELNADGGVISEFCTLATPEAAPIPIGKCIGNHVSQATGECNIWEECSAGLCDNCKDNGWIEINKPAGTYYYGIRIWAEGETKPDYPAPLALAAGATAGAESEEKGFVELIKCLFPRLITKTPTPRMSNQGMTPRIDCIKENGIEPLRSKLGALSATRTRGRKLGGKVLAKAITVNGVRYREI